MGEQWAPPDGLRRAPGAGAEGIGRGLRGLPAPDAALLPRGKELRGDRGGAGDPRGHREVPALAVPGRRTEGAASGRAASSIASSKRAAPRRMTTVMDDHDAIRA